MAWIVRVGGDAQRWTTSPATQAAHARNRPIGMGRGSCRRALADRSRGHLTPSAAVGDRRQRGEPKGSVLRVGRGAEGRRCHYQEMLVEPQG